MKKLVLLAMLFGLSITLNAQAKPNQIAKFQASYNNLKALVKTQQYQFVAEWVFKNKKREQLNSESNIIKINKSNISGHLGILNSEKKTIDANSTIENYKVSFKDNEQQVLIKFNIGKDEYNIDVNANGNTFLTASSSNSNTISWKGKLKKLK